MIINHIQGGTSGNTENLKEDVLEAAIIAAGESTGITSDGVTTDELLAAVQELSDFSNSNYIKIRGSRGALSGYQQSGTAYAIDATSLDANETSNYVTISNGVAGTAWTKIIRLTAASPVVSLGSLWSWVDGEAPTLVQNGMLVCCWCGSAGVANFVSAR